MGLPRPTTDLDQLKADLDEHGYCIVADALSPDEVTALRTRITEQAAAERAPRSTTTIKPKPRATTSTSGCTN